MLLLPSVGGFSSVKSSKALLCVTLEMESGPGPQVASCFLTAAPSSVHLLLSHS